MGPRITMYMPDDALAALARRGASSTDGLRSMSGGIATAIVRYHAIMARERPRFASQEWCAICDALNGVWLRDDAAGASSIWAEVADTRGLGQKWGVDQDWLATRLRTMSYARRCSVVDVVEQFWAATEKQRETGQTNEELLAEILGEPVEGLDVGYVTRVAGEYADRVTQAGSVATSGAISRITSAATEDALRDRATALDLIAELAGAAARSTR